MADDPAPKADDKPAKTFTQDDVDRIVADRIQRERGKYADYDDLKAKAAKADELEDKDRTESQKLAAKLAKAEQAQASAEAKALRLEVAAEKGVPAHLITGSSKEEMVQAADDLLAFKGEPVTEVKDTQDTRRGVPAEDLKSGATPGATPEENDPAKLAATVPFGW